MGDYGLKISKDGYDVKTATSTQLSYSSQWSNFKIKEVITTTVTLTGADTSGSNTVNNPLSYSPIYFPYVNSSTISGKWRPALMGGTVSMPDDTNWAGVVVNYRPATNDFYCYISHIGSGTRTFIFKIIIFVDKFTGSGASITAIDDYGLKVSKSGSDVLSVNDHDLSMTSKFANLTVAVSGTSSITDTGNVTHGLGYVPIYLVFYNPTGDGTWGGRYIPMPTSGTFNGGTRHVEVWVDNNKMYFSTQDAVNATNFRYIIFNERITS